MSAKDTNVGAAIKAVTTASDPTDYYQYGNYNSNSNANSNSNLNSNINSNVNSNSNVNGNTNTNTNTNGNTNSTITSEESTSGIKAIEGAVNLTSSSDGAEATIKVNDSIGSTVNIINVANKLLVKSTGNIKYGSDQSKWSEFSIGQLKDKSIQKDIFSLNVDSGFSVKGQRWGNEKIDNVRCFKYHIDSLEIGDSLAAIGITSDLVPTLSGDVWIGIKDKLIHKMSLKITTPVSSAVRMINLDLNFSEFDAKNTITQVASSDRVTGTIGTTLTGDDKRKSDVKSLITALELYKKDNKSYPVSTDLLKLNSTDNAVSRALVPRYLQALPADPKTASGWYYAYKSTDGSKCSVSARLENQNDTEGSLVNNVLLYLKYSSD
jgi:hypothetical protein